MGHGTLGNIPRVPIRLLGDARKDVKCGGKR